MIFIGMSSYSIFSSPSCAFCTATSFAVANANSFLWCGCDAGLRRGALPQCWRLLGWWEERGCYSDDNDTWWHVYTRLHVLLCENITQSSSTRLQRTCQHCNGCHWLQSIETVRCYSMCSLFVWLGLLSVNSYTQSHARVTCCRFYYQTEHCFRKPVPVFQYQIVLPVAWACVVGIILLSVFVHSINASA